MNSSNLSLDQSGGFWRRWGGVIIGVIVLALVASVIWYMLSGTASTKREAPSTPMLMLPPPPPPPPEPEKLPEPTPEKPKVETEEPKPSPIDKPKDEAPSPAKDLSNPMTINGDAQAGTDAFGIGAGHGGGMTGGGGFGAGSYDRYVANALQQALARDARTKQLAFDDLTIDVWLDADGKVTRTQLVHGTGTPRIDDPVMAVIGEFRIDERPTSVGYHKRIVIKGRRP